MCGVEAIGFWARCGGHECDQVLFFQNPEATVVCQECKSVCDLYGAIVEYHTLAMRIGMYDTQAGDFHLNELAETGWVVDKMQVVKEPNASDLLAVYLLRRLVANQRFVNDLEAEAGTVMTEGLVGAYTG